VRSGARWVEVAEDLRHIDAGHSIAVLFSEAVDERSAEAGIQVVSGKSGIVDLVGADLVVYTPNQAWIPETPLSLVVSADVKDASGLRMGKEYRERFMPLVPYMELIGLTAADGETITRLDASAILEVSVADDPDGLLSLTIAFSASFDAAAKVLATERVSLEVFFPGNLPGPVKRSVWWPSDDTLVITLGNVRASDDASDNYYALLIPGGVGGIHSATGLYLKEDASVYLKAVR
jgi:hypothetical protein